MRSDAGAEGSLGPPGRAGRAGRAGHPGPYCDRCGEPQGDPAAPGHAACAAARALEPPRYCTSCRRRMIVQVTPTGWSARCSAHGEIGS